MLGKQLCSGWVSGSSGVVKFDVRVDFSFSLSSQLLEFSPELFGVFGVVKFFTSLCPLFLCCLVSRFVDCVAEFLYLLK